jgi:arginine exporter protein ArgO
MPIFLEMIKAGAGCLLFIGFILLIIYGVSLIKKKYDSKKEEQKTI